MTRVVVVGGGVAGATTVYWLARAGAEVTAVDNAEPGGATAAGAGIVQPWSSGLDGPHYDLYAAGAAFYPTQVAALVDDGEVDIGYATNGSLVVDTDPAALDEVERRVQARTRDVPVAGTVERLDPASARQLFPALAPQLAAVHVSGGARVDGRRLRAALLRAAQERGARLVHEPATVVRREGAAPLVHAAGRPLEADAVVVAAGAWTNQLLAPLGYEVPVEPQRGQITHLRLDDVDTSGWPSVLPPGGHYLVTLDDGRVLAGATRETGSGFDARVTAAGQLEVLSRALAVAPGLAAATVLETRVGLRPMAALPRIGPVPGHPGLYLNVGFGAGGLTMAPLVGHALAQLVLTGRSDVDLTPFAPA
jgi:D-amino-acid dehydrogenase